MGGIRESVVSVRDVMGSIPEPMGRAGEPVICAREPVDRARLAGCRVREAAGGISKSVLRGPPPVAGTESGPSLVRIEHQRTRAA